MMDICADIASATARKGAGNQSQATVVLFYQGGASGGG